MRVLTGSMLVVFQLGVALPGGTAAQSQPTAIPPLSLHLEEVADADDADSPWHERLLTALGGAAVGAGVGFFTSQVFTGDWDEDPGRYQVDRSLWAAVGGSVGFVVGFTVPLSGSGRAAPARAPGMRGGRFTLSADEIDGTGVKTAYEAVEVLRPEWFNTRGPHVPFESPQDRIQVYLDEVRLGGVETLSEITAENVRSLHFLDAGAATVRFGARNSHGAILVIAKGGVPRG